MPLMHYTTKVPAKKTAGEIVAILTRHGAGSILLDYDDQGEVTALSWHINNASGGLSFRLPVNAVAVQKVLQAQYEAAQGVSRSNTSLDHARRVAWRILKAWVGLQMALLDTGSVTLEQLFLPYLLVNNRETLYDRMVATGFKMLALPDPDQSAK